MTVINKNNNGLYSLVDGRATGKQGGNSYKELPNVDYS
jgi:hypothetical protein